MAENKRFIIGGFEFETYYEYRAAQEDVRKIECINEELDIQDPEVALRLYNDIRDGIITFNSPIGKQYADHVADIVANKSAGMLGDREIIEEAAGKAKISWTVTGDVVHYYIYRADDETSEGEVIAIIPAATGAYTNTKLTSGATYYYHIDGYTIEDGKLKKVNSSMHVPVTIQ